MGVFFLHNQLLFIIVVTFIIAGVCCVLASRCFSFFLFLNFDIFTENIRCIHDFTQFPLEFFCARDIMIFFWKFSFLSSGGGRCAGPFPMQSTGGGDGGCVAAFFFYC